MSRTDIHVDDGGVGITTVDGSGQVHGVRLDWHALGEIARTRGRLITRSDVERETAEFFADEQTTNGASAPGATEGTERWLYL